MDGPTEKHVIYTTINPTANTNTTISSETMIGASVEVYTYDTYYKPYDHFTDLRTLRYTSTQDTDTLYPYHSNGVCSGIITHTYIPDIRHLQLLPHSQLLNASSQWANEKYRVLNGSGDNTANTTSNTTNTTNTTAYTYINGSIHISELGPTPAPYVLQSYIETSLRALFEPLPVWLEATCQARMHEYFCLSSYLQPKSMTVQDLLSQQMPGGSGMTVTEDELTRILEGYMVSHPPVIGGRYSNVTDVLGYAFHIPTYPDISVCDRYEDECGGYIDSVADSNPHLKPHCNATMNTPVTYIDAGRVGVDTEVPMYGNRSDTSDNSDTSDTSANSANHSHFNIAIYNNTNELLFYTNNTYSTHTNILMSTLHSILLPSNSPTYPYITLCPHGFVVPDNPSNPRTQWIPNTGCAIACKIPLFTDAEWDSFILTARVVSYTGLVLGLMLLFTQLIDPIKRMEHMITCLAVVSLIHTVMSSVTHIYEPEDRLCIDNNIPYEAVDGLWNICAIQSFFNIFITYAVGICWLMQ